MFRFISKLSVIAISVMAGYFSASLAMQEIASIDQYHDLITQSRPSVILFYSPTCSVCKNFKPIYAESAKSNSSKGNFFAVDATKPEFRDTMYELGVQEVPAVIYKQVGFINETEFNKSISAFLDRPTKIAKATPSRIIKPTKKPIASKSKPTQKKTVPNKPVHMKGKTTQKLALNSNRKNK